KPAFEHLDRLERIVIECAEKTKQVARIVYVDPVQKHEILITPSAPDKQTRTAFGTRGYSGFELNDFHDVDFTKQGGEDLHLPGIDGFRTGVGTVESFPHRIGLDDYLGNLFSFGLHHDPDIFSLIFIIDP